MEIPSKLVCEILKEKGISQIFHANSILTSCLFLQNQKLLSRGNVKQKGLYQTPQDSDKIDRKYGIWHDIFLDTVDIHRRANARNQYGPVTFVFDINVLIKNYTGKIWITKLNPTKWAGKKKHERWFQNADDLRENLVIGNFDHMIVLRHCGGELPFKKYLSSILIDNPNQRVNQSVVDIFSQSVGALKLAKHIGQINVPLKQRKCNTFCKCKDQYLRVDILNKMFLLKNNNYD